MGELYHYGTKYHSGRYPYGSGDNPYQHDGGFLSSIKDLQKQGLSEKEIAENFGMTIREYRAERSLAKDRVRKEQLAQMNLYFDQGLNPEQIGKKMGIPGSTVRSMLKTQVTKKAQATEATVSLLQKTVDGERYLDIGSGVAASLGITDTRLETAVQALRDKGYTVHTIFVEQQTNPGKFTTVKVLAQPGVEKGEILSNKDKIAVLNERFVDQHSPDLYQYKPVKSISGDRIAIRYADEGGKDRDGLIEIRRGAEGLDMGESRYAQVRIAVDGTHYLKGMAVYSEDLPDGVDILFNSNKTKAECKTPKDAMKTLKGDLSSPTDAFESTIKKGGQRGYLNLVNEEGDWDTWSKSIASQVLSKQTVPLAKRQLKAAEADMRAEYEEITSLTNPALKAYLLEQFAGKCDTAAEELKAAAMPRQSSHVILPVPGIKDNEVYAPNYKDGEKVVLIRYPHGGTFEIPELKVNNRNKDAKKILPTDAKDAIGISSKTAERLSGADFDGDTVLVIPDPDNVFISSPALKELQGFEPKVQYKKNTIFSEDQISSIQKRLYKKNPEKASDIAKEYGTTVKEVMSALPPKHITAQKEMGVVSNLITDMTLQKAKPEEIARAVRYSMVVIDAEKHNLDYKQAKIDNDISSLHEKYQGKASGGASTLISLAGAEARIPKRQRSYRIDPNTGTYIYRNTGETYTDKKGKTHLKTEKASRMSLVDDAYKLSSGTAMEAAYADYANSMKQLAAEARKESLYSESKAIRVPEMAKKYASEVQSLKAKVSDAVAHQPIERKAQLLASTEIYLRKKSNPDMTKEQEGKFKAQALANARASLGGKKPQFSISDKEWEAIQSGAVSKTQLETIFRYTDQDLLKERAMPRNAPSLTPGKVSLAKSRLAMGYTLSQVADMMGVSVSTLKKALA